MLARGNGGQLTRLRSPPLEPENLKVFTCSAHRNMLSKGDRARLAESCMEWMEDRKVKECVQRWAVQGEFCGPFRKIQGIIIPFKTQ